MATSTASETAIETECVTKVTSYGSQYSTPASTTKIPTTPQEGTGEAPKATNTDLNVVSSTLATIQEHLNESAEEAMLPSPPINTPEGPSPEPSVVGRNKARNSVFGEFGDRIAEVLFDSRHRRVQMDSVSNQSVRSFDPSTDDGSVSSASDSGDESSSIAGGVQVAVQVEDEVEVGEIPICLGSPRPNPLIEEYQSFQGEGNRSETNGEPTSQPVAEPNNTSVIPTSTSTIPTNTSTIPILGLPLAAMDEQPASISYCGGVPEKSNWADECEDCIIRGLHRLEQLVKDEAEAANSHDHAQRYIAHLTRMLANDKREYPIEMTATPKARGARLSDAN